MNRLNFADNTYTTSGPQQPGNPRLKAAVLAATIGFLAGAQPVPAQPFPVTPVGDIFVIAMENHNFSQPSTMTNPQQILANPAAPFINSLITPGNPPRQPVRQR